MLVFIRGSRDEAKGICCFSAIYTALMSNIGNTGWLGIRIMCASAEACLPMDCYFS
jgi:hypothetical protein